MWASPAPAVTTAFVFFRSTSAKGMDRSCFCPQIAGQPSPEEHAP
jgi:hypothetical protein